MEVMIGMLEVIYNSGVVGMLLVSDKYTQFLKDHTLSYFPKENYKYGGSFL